MTARLAFRLLPVAVAAAGASLLPAQCTPDWRLDHGFPGADGPVHAAVRWDPDGAGPAPERVVFGGSFTFAGRTEAAGLVMWDPVTAEWSELAGGIDGEVRSLHVRSNHSLAVGGTFTAVGGQPANNVAITDGTSWTPLPGGVDGEVLAFAELASGELVIGGSFATAGGAPAANLATWNGATFAALGGGTNGEVRALLRSGTELLVGGAFQSAGGIATGPIASWNGGAFQPIGASNTLLSPVSAMLLRSTGELLAAVNGNTRVMRWDGVNWNAADTGLAIRVRRLLETSTGAVFACGTEAVSPFADQVAELTGSVWTTRGATLDRDVDDLLELADGRVVACGAFAVLGSAACAAIGAWDGQGWASIETGCEGVVQTITPLANGDLIVGGTFRHIGDIEANAIARYDGVSWQPLGSGVLGSVFDALEAPNGDIYIAGYFLTAGGTPCNSVARWDGSTWHAIGTGVPFGILQTIALQPNGEPVVGGVIAGGDFIRRWDGSNWVPLGGGTSGTVYDILAEPNGDLIVGGLFTFADGQVVQNIARWDGTSWFQVGNGLGGPVYDLDRTSSGELYATGIFDLFTPNVHGLERFDGSNWSAVPGVGPAADAVEAPNGDLLVNVTTTRKIVRWDGASATPIASYTIPGISGSVGTLAFAGDSLFVGGRMSTEIAGFHNFAFSRLSTPCPATSFGIGGGCNNHQLTVDAPWVGRPVVETGANLPANALVLVARGLAPTSLPLPNLLPQGQAGCLLRVANPLLELTVSSAAGTTSTQWQLPNDPALGGVQVFAQLAPLTLLGGALTGVATSNAVELRVGAF